MQRERGKKNPNSLPLKQNFEYSASSWKSSALNHYWAKCFQSFQSFPRYLWCTPKDGPSCRCTRSNGAERTYTSTSTSARGAGAHRARRDHAGCARVMSPAHSCTCRGCGRRKGEHQSAGHGATAACVSLSASCACNKSTPM